MEPEEYQKMIKMFIQREYKVRERIPVPYDNYFQCNNLLFLEGSPFEEEVFANR